MRRALLVAGVAVAALGLSVSMMQAAQAEGPAAEVKTEAIFNDPTGDEQAQQALQNRVVELIEGAAQDSRIRMSMFYASDATIPEALVAAHQRGVNVQVMFDASTKSDFADVYKILSDEVGEDTAAESFVATCPQDRGCIGSLEIGGVTALNHNKFFLFSKTLDTSNVVVQSSANLHTGRDGIEGWNSGLVLAGRDAIYDSYDAYFDDQIAAKADNNYYDTREPVTQDNAKIHYYPRGSAGDPYNDPGEDTMATLLDHVECTGNSEVGTPDDHRTIIRVNQSIFSRPYLANKLVDLDAAGCYVEVTTTLPDNNKLAHDSLNSVLAATDSGYNGVGVSYYCQADPLWTHSKYVIVEGKYYGEADRKMTWTGSANWSTNSLRQADETVLQFEDPRVHDAFRANFHQVFDAATHQAANGDAIAC